MAAVEKKEYSPKSEDKQSHPASQDADELEVLLTQIKRKGARAALEQTIAKLRLAALETKAPIITACAPTSSKSSFPQKKPTLPSSPEGEEGMKWKRISKFYYSDDGYNKPVVTVYIDFPGIGASKDRVTCDFTTQKFDLQIRNHNGANYRMIKTPLEKDILPKECKVVVKKNQIKLKLKKVKGEFSYESWTRLTAKGGKRKDFKDDPSKSLMSMMKDMYDEGDDNTKKMIGEAMMKSRMGKGQEKEDKFGDDDL